MRAFNLLLIVILVAALSFGSLAQTIEQPSAYYSLDTIAADSTGKSPVTNDDSISGKSGRFDGVDDFINAGQYKGEQKLYTLSLWFKTSSTSSQRVFQRGKASACFYDPAINVDNGKLIVSESGCSSAGRLGGKYYQGTPITLGEWNHVVVVRDEDTVEVYLNGKLKLTDNDQPLPPLGTDGSVTIGASWGSRSTYSTFFSGLVDEIKSWNRPFTAAEVQSLYLSEKNPQSAQPLTTQTPSANTAPISTGLDSPTPLATQQLSGGGSGVQISGGVPTLPTSESGAGGGGSAPAIVGSTITIPSSSSSSQPLEITPFGTITTVAGNGGAGSTGDGSDAKMAKLNGPKGVAFDCIGNMYIADTGNHKIRRVEKSTGKITTIAGTGTIGPLGDGNSALQAQLSSPTKIGLDSTGNIYISDTGNNKIRKLTSIAGSKTLVCSDPTTTPLEYTISTATSIPSEVKKARDPQGKITTDDFGNVYTANGAVTGVTKEGKTFDFVDVVATPLNVPTDIYYSGDRPLVNMPFYGTGQSTNGMYYVTSEEIGDGLPFYGKTTIGPFQYSGPGSGGVINVPQHTLTYLRINARDITFDPFYNMYIADRDNHRIRKIDVKTGKIITVAGNSRYDQNKWVSDFAGDGGFAGQALLNSPEGLAFDSLGNLYVADTGNNVIRKIKPSIDRRGIVTTAQTAAVSGYIRGMAIDAQKNIYISTYTSTYPSYSTEITKINANTGSKSTLQVDKSGIIGDIAIDSKGNIHFVDGSIIRKFDPSTGLTTIVAGKSQSPGFSGDNGLAKNADLNIPIKILFDRNDNLYFIDRFNNRVRKVDSITQFITTVAGTSQPCTDIKTGCGNYGPAVQAQISPTGLAVDSSGNIYIGGNNVIRKVDAVSKNIATMAGTGDVCAGDTMSSCGDGGLAIEAAISDQSYNMPIVIDKNGNIYFSSELSQRIRKIDVNTGNIATVAGYIKPSFFRQYSPPLQTRYPIKNIILDTSNNDLYFASDVGYVEKIEDVSRVQLSDLKDLASCERIDAPTEVKSGQTFPITVQMKNTGTRIWLNKIYSLLIQSQQNFGIATTDLPVSIVNPTETATFSLTATAPSTEGTYTFSSIMSESGTTFGNPCEAQIKVNKNCNQYNYIPANSRVDKTSVLTGETYSIYCDYGKTGITCVKGSAGTADCSWTGQWVGTAAKFDCTAPQTAATIDAFCRLEAGTIFDNCCTSGPIKLSTITVGNPQNGGSCSISTSAIPQQFAAGDSSTVKVSASNTGTKKWSAGTYKFASKTNPTNFWGTASVESILSKDVLAGGSTEFTIPITAPLTAGNYQFIGAMKEGPTEFGSSCSEIIRVLPKSPSSQQVQCSSDGKTAKLSWSAGQGATGYKLIVNNAQVTPTGTSYDYTGVQCGTQYSWSVASTSSVGDSQPISSTFTCQCPVSDGSCINKNIPSSLNVGQSSTAYVTVTNTGDKPWSANHKLVSVNNIWGPTTEIQLPNIAKGSSQDLPISMTAPSTAGSYTFSWSLKDGATSFGIGCPSASVKVLPLAPTGPTQTCSADGTKATLSWTAGTGATGYGLVIDDATTASNPKDFETTTTATTYGYNLQCGRQYTWKVRSISSGGDSPELNGGTINCVCPASGGSCTNTDVPSKLDIGQTYSAKVKVSNTGNKVWTTTTHKLVPVPSSADIWGISEVALTSSVNPGANLDLTIPIKAPATAGDYPFSWSLKEGTTDFGSLCSSTIKVVPLAPASPQSSCSADGTKATLSWAAGTGATGYGLTIDGSPFTSSSTSYVYDKVQCGKQYSWSVKSTSAGGDSSSVNGAAFTCPCPVSAGTCTNMQVPTQLDVGQTYSAKAKVSNTGNKVWTTSTHKLASISSPANIWGISEVSLPSTVNPGANLDLAIPIKAPATAGDYQFSWSLRDGTTNFGTACTSTIKVVPLAAGGLKSTCSSDGTKATLSWAASSGATSYKVIVDGAQVANPTGTSYDHPIQCGKQYTWKITPTSSAGDSPSTDGTPFNCVCPINNAECVSLDAPLTVKINQNFQVSASMKNTGNTAWTNSYSLVSQQPFITANPAQVSSTVNPQSAVTLTLAAKAPATTGTYDMIWTMKDNLGRTFGQQCRRSILIESPVLEFEGDRLIQPRDVAVDARGDVYVADAGTNKIKKIDRITRRITTVAGTGQADFFGDSWPATSAKLNSPSGVIIDALNRLYIADTANNRIRALKIILSSIGGGGSSPPIVGNPIQISSPSPGVSTEFISQDFGSPPQGGDSWIQLPEYQPG